MSTQYETQGYTINNAGRRLVVDPITRIEGHMRCEVNINDQNVITNAVSCGTMFRGLEIILQGRDPRDAFLSDVNTRKSGYSVMPSYFVMD